MFLWSRHGFPAHDDTVKKDVFYLKMIRGWRSRRGQSRNKGGWGDGLMEWMSNCADDSG